MKIGESLREVMLGKLVPGDYFYMNGTFYLKLLNNAAVNLDDYSVTSNLDKSFKVVPVVGEITLTIQVSKRTGVHI